MIEKRSEALFRILENTNKNFKFLDITNIKISLLEY